MGIRRKTKNIKLSIIEVNDYFKELIFNINFLYGRYGNLKKKKLQGYFF